MVKSNTVLHKKGRGRPATGHDPTTTIRLSPEFREKVDEWAARQEDKPPRSEAIRRLVELGLAAAPKRRKEK
jgi:Arc/MetJ-type ribon-helix-helix transcriptional regulator